MDDETRYELECELDQLQFELDELHFEAQKIEPLVDDGLYADIYTRQRRISEINHLLVQAVSDD